MNLPKSDFLLITIITQSSFMHRAQMHVINLSFLTLPFFIRLLKIKTIKPIHINAQIQFIQRSIVFFTILLFCCIGKLPILNLYFIMKGLIL